MASIDFLIIGVYLVGITLFGLFVGRRDQSSDSFFLASRRSTWPVVGLSLLASNISSSQLSDRLPEEKLPLEIRPLASAVGRLLIKAKTPKAKSAKATAKEA